MNNEILGAVKDRLDSSAFGTFSTYLILAHWRVILFAFAGDLSPDQRIYEIEQITSFQTFLERLAIAGIFTLITLAVVPILKTWDEKWKAMKHDSTIRHLQSLARDRLLAEKKLRDSLLAAIRFEPQLQRLNALAVEVSQKHSALRNIYAQQLYGPPHSHLWENALNSANALYSFSIEFNKQISEIESAIRDYSPEMEALIKNSK